MSVREWKLKEFRENRHIFSDLGVFFFLLFPYVRRPFFHWHWSFIETNLDTFSDAKESVMQIHSAWWGTLLGLLTVRKCVRTCKPGLASLQLSSFSEWTHCHWFFPEPSFRQQVCCFSEPNPVCQKWGIESFAVLVLVILVKFNLFVSFNSSLKEKIQW